MSDEELARALAANFDADGNDLALARAEQSMTPADRAQSEANVRAFIVDGQRTLRPGVRREGGPV